MESDIEWVTSKEGRKAFGSLMDMNEEVMMHSTMLFSLNMRDNDKEMERSRG